MKIIRESKPIPEARRIKRFVQPEDRKPEPRPASTLRDLPDEPGNIN